MTTNSNDSAQPKNEADAAVTAILTEWGTPAADETATTSATSPAPTARPTVRWGALVWALLFGATAATTLWVLLDPARRDDVGDWLLTLSPLTATFSVVIVVGVVVALFGVVGLIRRGERARR
ncbi:hypothetical protein [Agromyces cerinus]|uniref:Uncharacterized protein n=1 Tax=Agromyces cerinus subsp. cerinus TaxID=232089 RepID=A0A1N6GR96_9MICO|nr:hypothetical protein [Agromyces cerinus]SIO10013.1 hypothetical protein SAMN05443544_2799 [Agromyces cerinus subsp. cerinus]